MARSFSLKGALFAVAVACFAAVGVALISQYQFGMPPCPWCVLQRLIFVVIGAVALLGAVLPAGTARRAAAGLIVLLCACGAAAALWQHFKAANSLSCRRTLADRIISDDLRLDTLLPGIFAPRASCADAAVSLLGVPFDFWSLGLFVLVGVAVLWRARITGR